MDQTLAGKIAIVTGGSRSIGRQTALELAAKGADVIFTFHTRSDAAAEVVGEIENLGRRAAAIQADFSEDRGVAEMQSHVQTALAGWDA
ncbi:MAG: SDR family NAD(P)-dependent oxidoreductase, partial [Pseudomonadota bacterium]